MTNHEAPTSPPHSWWLDELAHAGPEHLDPGYVAAYDQKAGFDPAPDLETLQRHGIGAQSTVLDLGAGTGKLAAALAPHCRRVIAVDVSPAMVAGLRDRVRDAGLDNVDVVHAGLLGYEHTGDPADAVYTRNTLHQVPDFWKGIALHRIAGVLEPGGLLRLHDLAYDFAAEDAPEAMEAWFAGAVDDPARGWTPAELAEHVRTEFSTYTWILEGLLERAGFTILEREVRRGVYATYTCRLAEV